jgi:hypothetical protein
MVTVRKLLSYERTDIARTRQGLSDGREQFQSGFSRHREQLILGGGPVSTSGQLDVEHDTNRASWRAWFKGDRLGSALARLSP